MISELLRVLPAGGLPLPLHAASHRPCDGRRSTCAQIFDESVLHPAGWRDSRKLRAPVPVTNLKLFIYPHMDVKTGKLDHRWRRCRLPETPAPSARPLSSGRRSHRASLPTSTRKYLKHLFPRTCWRKIALGRNEPGKAMVPPKAWPRRSSPVACSVTGSGEDPRPAGRSVRVRTLQQGGLNGSSFVLRQQRDCSCIAPRSPAPATPPIPKVPAAVSAAA